MSMRAFRPSRLRDSLFMRSIAHSFRKEESVPVLFKQFQAFSTSNHLANVTCAFQNGHVVLTIPLPSRSEDCDFILRPVSHTVKSLVSFVQDEDGGVDRIAVYSNKGTKISNSTTIDILIQSDFKVVVNDKTYDVTVPQADVLVPGLDDPMSNAKNLISQLYTDLSVQEYKDLRERQIKVQLESLTSELQPLEEMKAVIDANTAKRTNMLVWAGLGYMALQFGFLARLTWWEYSWDIMEPVTYFVTYAGSMVFYAYFVLTREDSNYPEIRNRLHLLSFYKSSNKKGLDVAEYNAKKEIVAKLEHELKLLQSPPVFADITKPIEN